MGIRAADQRAILFSPGFAFYFGVSIPAFLLPALVLGYPLLYQDTVAYAHGGFIDRVNGMCFDIRSPFYSYFLFGVTFFGRSLWLASLVQAGVAAYVLNETYEASGLVLSWPVKTLCNLGLALFSTLSWFVCFLTPDVFTGFIPLLCFCLVRAKTFRWMLWALLAVCVVMHNANLYIMMVFFAACLPWAWLTGRGSLRAAWRVGPALALAVLTLLAAGWVRTGKPVISETGGSVFLVNRWLADKTLQPFIIARCAQGAAYAACGHLDALPDKEEELLWGDGPWMRELGGFKGGRSEFNRLALDYALSRPGEVVDSIVRNTLSQLQNSGIPLWSFDSTSSPWQHGLLFGIYPDDAKRYARSAVHQEPVRERIATALRALAFCTLAAAGAVGVLLLALRGRVVRCAGLFWACAGWYVANALVCAGVSGSFERYAGRVSWLLLLGAMLCVLDVLPRNRAGGQR